MSVTHPGDSVQVDIVGDARPAEQRAPENVSPFRLFDILWRRKLTVLLVAAVVMAVAARQILVLPARYEATSIVLVDTRQNKLSDLQAIVAGAQADSLEVRTQVDILRSPALIERVAAQLDLVHAPEFAAGFTDHAADWRRVLNDVLALFGQAPAEAPVLNDETRLRSVTGTLLGDKITITNDGRSYVISISVRCEDPELAARIANTIAQVYLDFNRQLKDRAVVRANAWLEERLAPMQGKLRAAERAVGAFREQNGMVEDRSGVNSGGMRVTIAGQSLAQVNAQLGALMTERQTKEAAVEEIRRALAGKGDLLSIPQVVASPLVQLLRGQEATLSAREASLALTQSDASPALRAARAERQDVRARIAAEAQKIIGSVESEANAAREREITLRQSMTAVLGTVSDQAKSEIRLRELESEAAAARTVLTDYLNRAERNTNERDIQQPDAELISLASVPLGPAPPTKRQYLFIALVGAALAGVIAALVRDRLEPGFRTAEQLEADLGLPVLGFMPIAARRKQALTLDTRDVAYVEAMSNVRSVLQLSDVAGRPRVILITSALPQEGKTFFAISLARSVALAGGRCLLIDCDMRRPAVAATVGIDAEPGTSALTMAGGLLDQLVKRDSETKLDIITAADAPTGEPTLVSSANLKNLVDDARKRYDLVVIDAPPVLAFVDARVLSQISDSTVLVVRWRKTPRALVQSAVKALRVYGGRIAGTVITQVDLSQLGATEGSHAYVLRKYGAYFR